MKKIILFVLTLIAVQFSVSAQTMNKLTATEKAEGYKLLFNGENTDGWHAYNKEDAGAWRVNDGIIKLDTHANGQADLVTNKQYENFELKLDWRIPEGGNSGIIFPVHEDTTYAYTYLTGMEMQILDDKNAEDNKQTNHLAGSLYDMIAPAYPAKSFGEWNSVIIRKLNGHITFWLNDKKVVDIQMDSPEWKELIQKSKFKNWKAFATYPKGRIALQDHGAAVAFRNIRIKQL
jgi:hypothetical protein